MGAGRRHVPFPEVRKRHVFRTNYHLAAEWDPHGHCLLSSCPKPGTVTPAPVTSNKGLGWVSNPGASLKRVAFSSQVRGQGPGTVWCPRSCLSHTAPPGPNGTCCGLRVCARGACSALLLACWALSCPPSESKLPPNKALGPRSVDCFSPFTQS